MYVQHRLRDRNCIRENHHVLFFYPIFSILLDLNILNLLATLFTNTVTQSVLIERNKNFDCICNEESDCQQRGKSIYRISVPRLIIFVRSNCMIFILLSYICTQFKNPIDLNLQNIHTKNCNPLD